MTMLKTHRALKHMLTGKMYKVSPGNFMSRQSEEVTHSTNDINYLPIANNLTDIIVNLG